MGRLFDAVSSLLGVRHVVSYEAQAAIEMEIAASAGLGGGDYRFAVAQDQIDPAPVLAAWSTTSQRRRTDGAIAAGFHMAVLASSPMSPEQRRDDAGIAQVALSGGVFQNVLLVRLTRAHLIARGFDVLTHRLVPPNDGGLALRQVAVAAHSRPGQEGCQGESWNS
jgi:hydrogenase maturation protein HypF